MSQARNPFVEALSAHDVPALREAFDRANAKAERTLHRTTLTRWLDESVPQDGDFVRIFATELEDDNIFDAWQAARGTRSSSAAKSIVSRYEALSAEDKLEAYVDIRRSFLETRFPKLYDRLSYRVEVHDSHDHEHLVIRMTMEYDSSLPEGAFVQIVARYADLGDAYQDPKCVFRDLVPFPPDDLRALLERGPAPVLAYNHIDRSGQRMITHEGRLVEKNVFEFGNESVDQGRIRLSIDYAWPRGRSVFPIRFGEFRVAGGAEFTLVLNARGTSIPRAFAYPPAGRDREWAVDRTRPNELVASLGAGGTILADGDGLILMWSEET